MSLCADVIGRVMRSSAELDEYYARFKQLVQETYRDNGNEKAIVVCHSMGTTSVALIT